MCGVVERFVDLVERFGVELALGIGCFVLGNVGVMLCRWWAVENYIWGLLLLYIVQSPRFTNNQYGGWGKYLSVVHAHLAQYNKQQVTT
jgi:hypothetical protein